MSLYTIPIELEGDWRESPPEQAALVIERVRDVCFAAIDLCSDRQPDQLRVQSRITGPPHIWLSSPTIATIVVDGSGCNWCRLSYQLGHELGHVLCNSWQPRAIPLPPSQWMEESIVEAFTLRGLARLADSWEQKPVLAGYRDFAKHLRRYRELTIAPYRAASSPHTLHRWFGEKRSELENGVGGRIPSGPMLLMIMSELDRDSGCVADLGALNRWPSRTAAPIEAYLEQWQTSCDELGAPGRLPRRIRDVLFFDEPAPLTYDRPAETQAPVTVQQPNRGEVQSQIVRIDDLVAPDHPVRAVWRLSESLDLGFLADASDLPKRPAPTLLFSLWLWAASEGIGSARHIARLCGQLLVYRWLCGGVPIDHQILIAAARQPRLDRLLAHALAVLVHERILPTALTPPDAPTGAESPDRCTQDAGLKALAGAASAHVRQLRETLDRDDAVADEYQARAIAQSSVQDREARVRRALERMKAFDGEEDAPHSPAEDAPARAPKRRTSRARPAPRRVKAT